MTGSMPDLTRDISDAREIGSEIDVRIVRGHLGGEEIAFFRRQYARGFILAEQTILRRIAERAHADFACIDGERGPRSWNASRGTQLSIVLCQHQVGSRASAATTSITAIQVEHLGQHIRQPTGRIRQAGKLLELATPLLHRLGNLRNMRITNLAHVYAGIRHYSIGGGKILSHAGHIPQLNRAVFDTDAVEIQGLCRLGKLRQCVVRHVFQNVHHVSRGLHVRTVIGHQCGQFPYRLLGLRIRSVDMLGECFNAGLRFVGVAGLNL